MFKLINQKYNKIFSKIVILLSKFLSISLRNNVEIFPKFFEFIKKILYKFRNYELFYQLDHLKINNINIDKNLKMELTFLGSSYGGWTVPKNFINPSDICYSFGLGKDISFDLEIIKELDVRVFGFDPTPKSIRYINDFKDLPSSFKSYPFGIWSKNTKLKFFSPNNPQHISHSIVNIQNTKDFIVAECKDLSTIMKDLNHKKIDILKMDVEGAEFKVLDNILNKNINIKIILIEFHGDVKKIIGYVQKIISNGYSLINYRNTNLTFIKNYMIRNS